MQNFVTWWCHLIGVTDAAAIQIATGIIASAPILFVAYFIAVVVIGLMTVPSR